YGVRNIEAVNILLDQPLRLEVLLPYAAMRRAHRCIDKMLHTISLGRRSYALALADFAIKPDVRKPVVLDAEDTVGTFERDVQFGAVVHITSVHIRKGYRAKTWSGEGRLVANHQGVA